MKICVVQSRSIKGDIPGNIGHHKQMVQLAVVNAAEMVIFPELSVTNYEPTLAKELATAKSDDRFNELQAMSDSEKVTIGIGVPTKNPEGIYITMVILQPNKPRETYSKKYLHVDEEPFFVSGKSSVTQLGEKKDIALAICYELSVPAHSEDAYRHGAKIYLVSVAKTANGMVKAMDTLSGIAIKYHMQVLISNAVGEADGDKMGGRSAVMNQEGVLLAQLDDSSEGILIYDTVTEDVLAKTL
jgi:predicted amidohydrolase